MKLIVLLPFLIANVFAEEGDEMATLNSWLNGWDDTGVTPGRVAEAPLPLYVLDDEWEPLRPGQEVDIAKKMMLSPGFFTWDCNPVKKYALVLMDNEGMPANMEFFNYLVYNIRNCNVSKGYEAFDYMRPFVLDYPQPAEVSDGEEPNPAQLTENSDKKAPFLFLVYEQNTTANINMDMETKGCHEDMVRDRVVNMTNWISTFGLKGPVGGNVILVPANTDDAKNMTCHISKCVDREWPVTIAGVNENKEGVCHRGEELNESAADVNSVSVIFVAIAAIHCALFV